MDKRLRVSYFNLKSGVNPYGSRLSEPCVKPQRRSKSRMHLSPNAQRRLMADIQRSHKWGAN